jgi:NAD(P)H dehydrogenase (quinone)
MYAITGITGQVGGAVAESLTRKDKRVRAIVRDARKGRLWADRGCEVACADVNDSDALTKAFVDAEGVFVMLPPIFDPSPGFTEARETIESIRKALVAASPAKTVCLSTIGGQVEKPNLLNQLHMMEQVIGGLNLPITFVRPAWFMENCAWDVTPAQDRGMISSFLQPLEKPVPMVATADIGELIAELLLSPDAVRVVELEGPERISPHQIAAAFSKLLEKDVTVEIVPRNSWESLFRAQGMTNPLPRIEMLDGFNEGWIEFEGKPRKGSTPLDTVLRQLIEQSKGS